MAAHTLFYTAIMQELEAADDPAALDSFLQKFASKHASEAHDSKPGDSIPAAYMKQSQTDADMAGREHSMIGNSRWMNAY